PHMYNVLLSRQPAAIQNAKKLYSQRSPSPARDNPSTTVFMLVEELNKHLRK
ncbi:MAG: RloB domain-containing protein, partial [Trichococcus flocculiformis]|nr:RloB domain-containing protein [Trichococcus flocculiformis]